MSIVTVRLVLVASKQEKCHVDVYLIIYKPGFSLKQVSPGEKMSDSGQETPTEYGEWIEDDLDWDDISEKFNSERSTAIVIAVVSLIIGNSNT